MDQRRKIFWLYVFMAFALPAVAYAIWKRGLKPGDQWIVGAMGILCIAKLIWAWRQQRLSDKHLCFLCGLEWTPSPASQKQFICDECNRLWLVNFLRRPFRQKPN